MELLSNLLWLATCLFAGGVWAKRFRLSQTKEERARSTRALVLLVLLLFPVISVSDDLQMNLIGPATGLDAPFYGDLLFFALVLALMLFLLRAQKGWFVLTQIRDFCGARFESLNVTKRPPPVTCFA